LLGYEESEWVGCPGEIIFTPEDRAVGEPQKELEAAQAHGEAAHVRWHLRKDGSRIFADGMMPCLRDGGRHLGFAKIMKDATDRQVAQESLNAILESISDAFYAVDSELRFTSVKGSVGPPSPGTHWPALLDRIPRRSGTESYGMHLRCMTEREPVRVDTISPITGRRVGVSLYPGEAGRTAVLFP
jgi:PAS domain S-box-containing protein